MNCAGLDRLTDVEDREVIPKMITKNPKVGFVIAETELEGCFREGLVVLLQLRLNCLLAFLRRSYMIWINPVMASNAWTGISRSKPPPSLHSSPRPEAARKRARSADVRSYFGNQSPLTARDH
jgi:hypothetical protein